MFFSSNITNHKHAAQHESAGYPCSSEGQLRIGLYQQKRGQQVKKSDYFTLLGIYGTATGVLYSLGVKEKQQQKYESCSGSMQFDASDAFAFSTVTWIYLLWSDSCSSSFFLFWWWGICKVFDFSLLAREQQFCTMYNFTLRISWVFFHCESYFYNSSP